MKHTLQQRYKIGDHVLAKKLYSMKCSERFTDITDGFNVIGRNTEAYPSKTNSLGELSFIVGFQRAIMSNYSYTAGRTSQGFEDAYPEHERGSAKGKWEECLVVALFNTVKPRLFLVRPKEL